MANACLGFGLARHQLMSVYSACTSNSWQARALALATAVLKHLPRDCATSEFKVQPSVCLFNAPLYSAQIARAVY